MFFGPDMYQSVKVRVIVVYLQVYPKLSFLMTSKSRFTKRSRRYLKAGWRTGPLKWAENQGFIPV